VTEGPQEQGKIKPVRLPDGRIEPPIETRFKKGQSGNPGGRRKGASVVHELERRLALGAEFDEDGNLVRAGKEACEIADTLIGLARGLVDPKSVEVKAALAIIDRTDGPVRKEIDVSAEVTTKRVVLEREPPQ